MGGELEAKLEGHPIQEEMVEKIEQLQEDLVVEKNKEKKDRKWLNMVALSTALLVAFAAIAAMRGNYLANEAMLSQLKANDQWELYQAKSMKRHLDQTSVTLLQALEQESRSNFKRHELFAYSVAALQVGISLVHCDT